MLQLLTKKNRYVIKQTTQNLTKVGTVVIHVSTSNELESYLFLICVWLLLVQIGAPSANVLRVIESPPGADALRPPVAELAAVPGPAGPISTAPSVSVVVVVAAAAVRQEGARNFARVVALVSHHPTDTPAGRSRIVLRVLRALALRTALVVRAAALSAASESAGRGLLLHLLRLCRRYSCCSCRSRFGFLLLRATTTTTSSSVVWFGHRYSEKCKRTKK